MGGPAGDNPFDLDPDSRELWWLTRDDPGELAELLDAGAAPRKAVLVLCGCARLVLPGADTPAARDVIKAAEAFADGEADAALAAAAAAWVAEGHPDEDELADASAGQVIEDLAWATQAVSGGSIGYVMSRVVLNAGENLDRRSVGPGDEVVVRLLRCVYGKPFRPVRFRPGWRTEAVVGLARGMYESRDFDPLPVLADALEDAGCTHPGILAHCRGPGPHARGCWVVDGLLGKA